MKSRVIWFLCLFVLLLPVAGVQARELLVRASDVVAIRPSVSSQAIRLLIKFPLPDILVRKSVDFACAEFDVSCTGVKGAVSLEAFRVTTAWDATSVGWSGPWLKDGGDWDGEMSADWVVPAGEGKTVYLDVTDFVNGWLKEPSRNFGILVKVSEPSLGTFSTGRSQELPKLRILY